MPPLGTYDDVLRTACTLNETERVRLVGALIETFDSDADSSLDQAWLAEIDRRSIELDSGTIQTIPWSDVRRRACERAKMNG